MTREVEYRQAASAGDTAAMNALGELAQHADPPDLDAARQWFSKAADLGDIAAMNSLGSLYQHKTDPPDLTAAKHWYEKAADGGHADAMNEIGGLYWADKEFETAREWYEKSAAHACNIANYNLGQLHRHVLAPPNLETARRWYEKAADNGYAPAMNALGEVAQHADPPDLDAARQWFSKAADRGDVAAMKCLGSLYQHKTDPPDLAAAKHWYEKAADGGDSWAMNEIGRIYHADEDFETARRWYEKAAARGDASANYNLGQLHRHMLAPLNLETARRWYEKAADNGYAPAMNALGELAQHADPPDLDAARQWFSKAADRGDVAAMKCLGSLYQHKTDPPDLTAAKHWYEKAADGGDSWAMNEIGRIYHADEDFETARRWYEKAAARGDASANYNLGLLYQYKFDPPDLDAARNWYEKAAEGGHTGAYFKLGYLLQNQDRKTAAIWYERAAGAGEALAMNNLATLLEGRNRAAALEWYERGAAAGDATAKQNLARLRGTSSTESAPPTVERRVVPAHVRRSAPTSDLGGSRSDSTGVSALLSSLAADSPYRRNAFRLAALDVAVDRRGLARRTTELEASEKLGASLSNNKAILPVTPTPELADVKAALNQLREPVQRLVQEWFWLWSDERADPVIARLAAGDADGAAQAWLDQMNGDDAGAGIAAHNIAILRHIQALETSAGAAAATWLDALTAWDAAIVSNAVWQRLRARAARIDERRLCPSAVDEVRAELPRALLNVHATRIVRAAEDGDTAALDVHVAVLDRFAEEAGHPDSAFTTALIDDARGSAARTLAARVKSIADEELTHAAHEPTEASVAANRMLDRTRLSLQAIDRIRPATDPVRSGAHDDLVHAALQCDIRYYNATNDAAAGEMLLERLAPIATTDQTRSRLTEHWAVVATTLIVALVDKATGATQVNAQVGTTESQQLLEQAEPLFARIRARAEPDDERLAQACDLVARSAASCAVATYNETGALSPTDELLARAKSLAVGKDATEYIDSQIATLTRIQSERAVATTCWFCKERSAAPGRHYKVPMYGDATYQWNTKRWNSTTVEVPRCEDCWTAHQPAEKTRSNAGCFTGLGCTCTLFGFILALVLSGSSAGGFMLFLGIAGLVTVVISAVVGRSTGDEEASKAMRYPHVAELERRGWKKGTGPA